MGCHAVEACQPLLEPTMVSVDVLHMLSAIDTPALAKVDGFMAEAFGITERRVGRVGIGDQQGICRKFRFEGGGQPRLGQGSVAHHEIQGLPSTVTRH